MLRIHICSDRNIQDSKYFKRIGCFCQVTRILKVPDSSEDDSELLEDEDGLRLEEQLRLMRGEVARSHVPQWDARCARLDAHGTNERDDAPRRMRQPISARGGGRRGSGESGRQARAPNMAIH